jgi:hypothetical protein
MRCLCGTFAAVSGQSIPALWEGCLVSGVSGVQPDMSPWPSKCCLLWVQIDKNPRHKCKAFSSSLEVLQVDSLPGLQPL